MSDIEGSEPGLAFSCEGSSDALWANDPVSNRKRFTASELFSRFLAPDKLQDTTAIQRRRFVAVPRHASKDYWQVERHPKIIAAPDLFRKSWNKNTLARLYVDECNRSWPFTAEGTVKS